MQTFSALSFTDDSILHMGAQEQISGPGAGYPFKHASAITDSSQQSTEAWQITQSKRELSPAQGPSLQVEVPL